MVKVAATRALLQLPVTVAVSRNAPIGDREAPIFESAAANAPRHVDFYTGSKVQ
jgi:hypothetical protein